MSGKLPSKFLDWSGKYPGNGQGMFGQCPGHVRRNFRDVVRDLLRKCPVTFQEMARTHPGNIRKIAWICPERLDRLPPGLTDSKKLTARQRADIETRLCGPDEGHFYAIYHSSVAEIDEKGILPATFAAMSAAVRDVAGQLQQAGYPNPPSLLVDGNLLPEFGFRARAIIKGDSLSLSIAAASILAKQTRDRLMGELAVKYPAYGWEKNAGYGTPAHQHAIAGHGITPHHRRSYAPIKRFLQTGH